MNRDSPSTSASKATLRQSSLVPPDYTLIDRRVLLLWDERVPVPSDWQQLTRCTFVGDELTWETGLELTKAILSFKR